jgi:hypothetical protein
MYEEKRNPKWNKIALDWEGGVRGVRDEHQLEEKLYQNAGRRRTSDWEEKMHQTVERRNASVKEKMCITLWEEELLQLGKKM